MGKSRWTDRPLKLSRACGLASMREYHLGRAAFAAMVGEIAAGLRGFAAFGDGRLAAWHPTSLGQMPNDRVGLPSADGTRRGKRGTLGGGIIRVAQKDRGLGDWSDECFPSRPVVPCIQDGTGTVIWTKFVGASDREQFRQPCTGPMNATPDRSYPGATNGSRFVIAQA